MRTLGMLSSAQLLLMSVWWGKLRTTHGSDEGEKTPANFLSWRQARLAIISRRLFRLAREHTGFQATYRFLGNEDALAIPLIRKPASVTIRSRLAGSIARRYVSWRMTRDLLPNFEAVPISIWL